METGTALTRSAQQMNTELSAFEPDPRLYTILGFQRRQYEDSVETLISLDPELVEMKLREAKEKANG